MGTWPGRSVAWQPGFRAWVLNQVTGPQTGAGRLCPDLLCDLAEPYFPNLRKEGKRVEGGWPVAGVTASGKSYANLMG